MFTLRAAFAGVLVLFLSACGGTAVSEITGPAVVRCQASVSTPPPLPATGAQVSLSVDSARECSWTASSEAAWIRVSPDSGQGNASLTLTVAENGTASERTGTIALNDLRVELTQEPAPCRFEISPPAATVSHAGGNTSIRVSTLEGCEWSASVSVSWLRVLPATGRGSATAVIDVDANGGTGRSGEVTIAGTRVTIQQDAAPAPAPAPVPPAPPPATPPSPPPPPATPPPAPPPPAAQPPATPPPATPPPATPPPATPPPATPPPATQPPATPPPAPPPPAAPPPAMPPPPAAPPPVTPPSTPPPSASVEVTGSISGLTGSCPNVTFTVSGTTVMTDASTRFNNGACPSLRDGRAVKVRGVVKSTGTLLAEVVERQN